MDVLGVARRALKQLYPDRRSVLEDGRPRLFHLYADLDGQHGRDQMWFNPSPYGMAVYEWRYLEGEIACVDWRALAQDNVGEEFPPRIPPFPVKQWLRLRSKLYRDYPRVHVKEWSSFSLMEYEDAIARAAWILFVNDIPYGLWKAVILVLIEHDVRLALLSKTRGGLEEVGRLREGILPTTRGTEYLHSLSRLLASSGTKEGHALADAAKHLLIGIQCNRSFRTEALTRHLDELQSKLEVDWKRFQGPDKRYTKSERLLKPIVSDLISVLLNGLERRRSKASIEREVLWLQAEPVRGASADGVRVNESHLYRLASDLLRFFYRWNKYKDVGALDPLPWRGDRAWSGVAGVGTEERLRLGEKIRLRYGKRIQSIYQGGGRLGRTQ